MKKSILCTAALAAALGFGGLAVSAGSASAAVVCNAAGDCWHVDHRDRYPGVALTYHPDDWYFHRHWDNDRDHHWRDYHEGRGYYDHGAWVPR